MGAVLLRGLPVEVARVNVSASTRIAAAKYTLREAASLIRAAKASKTSVSYTWYSLRLAAHNTDILLALLEKYQVLLGVLEQGQQPSFE